MGKKGPNPKYQTKKCKPIDLGGGKTATCSSYENDLFIHINAPNGKLVTLKAVQFKKLVSKPIVAKVKKHFAYLSNFKTKSIRKPAKKKEIKEEEDEDLVEAV